MPAEVHVGEIAGHHGDDQEGNDHRGAHSDADGTDDLAATGDGGQIVCGENPGINGP